MVDTGDLSVNRFDFLFDALPHRTPVQTIFEAHENGVVSMAMTPDAKYLVTLGTTPNQVISLVTLRFCYSSNLKVFCCNGSVDDITCMTVL